MLLLFSSGCGVCKTDKTPANYYYINPDRDLSTIGRAALVELANNSVFPQISVDVTEALFQEMQKKQVFGVTVIGQNDPVWRNLQLNPNTTYTLEQLSALRESLNSDTVLTGTVTKFKPYPHLTIGLRLKLIDLTDGQLLWALEQIWDTTDKTTEDRIKKYFRHHNFMGFATLREKLGTVSSLKFVKFVAYEVAETLRPKQ